MWCYVYKAIFWFLFSLGRVTLHELINVTVTGLDVGDGCVKLLRGWCSVGMHTSAVLVCMPVQCWSAYCSSVGLHTDAVLV